MHTDIKPDNIMFADSEETQLKVIDMGFAGYEHDYCDYIYGTHGYFAPECYEQDQQSTKSDVFSAGIIFYEMLTGHKLFKGRNVEELKVANRSCIINFSSIKGT